MVESSMRPRPRAHERAPPFIRSPVHDGPTPPGYGGPVRRRGLWVLVAALGCGDDPKGQPTFDEPPPVFEAVCGTEGPHLVLPLAAGEHAYRIGPLPEDDRVMVSTFLVDPQIPLAQFPPTLDLEIHAVGPCGEAPTLLARGLSLTQGYDDLVLACEQDGHGAYVLDPTGAQDPRPLLDGWCPLRSTAVGLLTVEAEPSEHHGALVLLRDPSDSAAQPEPLANGIRDAYNTYFGPGGNATTSLWAAGDQAVVLDDTGVVHRVDLQTGELTEELTGVREFRVSGDGRWMIWQALEPAEGEPETPVGPVFLRDLADQTDVHLLNTHLEWTGSPYAGEYLVVRDDVQGLRIFRAHSGEPVALPEGTDYRGVLDEGRLWLVRRVDDRTEELRWTPGEAEPFVFARHDGQVSRVAGGIEIFETDAVTAPNEGRLSFVSWDGGEPVVLADHVHQGRGRLADGRILTIVHEDDSHHGSLRLIDPEASAWVRLDPRGYVQSPRLNGTDPFDGDIAYAIDDPGGDGRGVYRARVPTSAD